MIKLAVCDDEKYMAEEIRKKIFEFFNSKNKNIIIKQFSSGKALLKNKEEFNIIFLDIQMDEPNGLQTAKLLRERGFKGYIIFITVLKEAVFKSFEAEPFDFLVKPFSENEFRQTMERLYSRIINSNYEKLCIKKKNEIRLINFDDIIYCEVINRKIYIHLITGEIIEFYEKMSNLESKLDQRFFKCHRSYLINLAHITGFNNNTVQMKNGLEIPVSRLRANELSHAILTYMEKNII